MCISKVIDVSPGNLDSSSCFIQPSILHDALCVCKLNKQCVNIQPWWTPFSILNQSVPCLVLTYICVCVYVCVCECLLGAQPCPTFWDPMDCSPTNLLCLWDFPSKNTGVGCQWVSLSRGSPQPRFQTWVSCIAGRFFTFQATRKPYTHTHTHTHTHIYTHT